VSVRVFNRVRVSRRTALLGIVGAAALPVLAACGAPAPTPAPAKSAEPAKPAAAPTTAPAAAPTTAPAAAPTTAPAAAPTKPAEAPAAAKPAGAKPAATISMIGLASHPSWIAAKEMAKAHTDKNPGTTFKLSEFGLPDINSKVNLDFQAKQGEYDIVWMNSANTVGYWTEAKIVVPLDELASKAYDLDDFIKLARNIGTMQGKLYGIAIMIEDRMYSYRKDLYDEAGIKVPTSIQEMSAAAEKLTKKDKNQFGWSQRNASAFGFFGWVYSYGGTFFTPDYKTQLTSPEVRAALDGWLGMEKFSSPATNRQYGDVVKELQTGVAAAADDVTIITPLLEDAKASQHAGKFGYAVAPPGPKGPRPMTSAHLLSISSLSKQREASWQAIEWMTGKENNRPWIFAGGAAFRESMYQDKEILAKYPQYTLFKEILDRGNPDYVPRIRASAEVLSKTAEQLNATVVGSKKPEQALSELDGIVAGILKREGYQK
jgi:multiple sugar transport system substrate-binding protein